MSSLSALSPSGPTVMTEAVAEEETGPLLSTMDRSQLPLDSLMLETAKRRMLQS